MIKLRLLAGHEGQSLIELAIAVPLLVLLLFGASEFGRLCYVSTEVTNAAHAGATYGAQSRATASDNPGMTVAAQNDGADLTGLAVTPAHLCAATYSDTPVADCSTTTAVEYVQVSTQVTVASLFNAYGFGGNYILHGQAIERVRQ
jgi:Flp pilus assembly protein TadG